MKPTRAQARVLEGAKDDFFKRHRKDRTRAETAWTALVAKGPSLEADTSLGDPVERTKWPKAWRDRPNLNRLELPNGFRAIYTVLFVQGEGRIVRIDWIGDHKEYDRPFGYSTS